MAVYRQLQISYWQDDFVNELTPEEKYFYIYLLTNSRTTQCGIYKFNKNIAVFETGYSRETIEKLLERFLSYGRIIVSKTTNELMVVNWLKYNFINSKNTITCMNSELKGVKDKNFLKKFYVFCKKLEYPVETIFRGINLFPNAPVDRNEEELFQEFEAPSKVLQGAYQDLGEEETETEIKAEEEIKENASEEIDENSKEDLKEISAEAAAVLEIEQMEVILTCFSQHIHPITPMEYERITDWLKDVECGVILLAIEEAVTHNGRSMSYINTVLNSWHGLGFNTEASVTAYKRERATKKTQRQSSENCKKINRAAYKVLGEESRE